MASKWIFLILVFFSCETTGQKKQDDLAIRSLIDSYSKAYLSKDWESVANLIHPEVFNFFSKNDFIKSVDDTLTREYYHMVENNLFVDSITPIIHKKEDKYALVYLRNESVLEMSLKVDSSLWDKVSLAVCKQLKESFKKDFVTCTGLNKRISYKIKEKAYVIFLKGQEKWFMLTKDEDSKGLVDKLIPTNIREKLGY